jgi:hypothetical protein
LRVRLLRGGGDVREQVVQVLVADRAVRVTVQQHVAVGRVVLGLEDVVVGAAHHRVVHLQRADLATGLVLGGLVTGEEFDGDADLLQLFLDQCDHLLGPRLGECLVEGEREALAVLLADPVGAPFPPGVVQQLPGLLGVVDVVLRGVRVAQGRFRQGTGGQRIVLGEQGRDDLVAVDTGDQGLTDLAVLGQWIAEAEGQAVVDAVRARHVQGQALGAELLLVRGLDLASHMGLLRGDRADPHTVLRRDDDLDPVQVRTALVLQVLRCPVVVRAGHQVQLGTDLFAVDHEGAGTDHLGGLAGAEVLARTVQAGRGQQP